MLILFLLFGLPFAFGIIFVLYGIIVLAENDDYTILTESRTWEAKEEKEQSTCKGNNP